jgi:hypothetical protein
MMELAVQTGRVNQMIAEQRARLSRGAGMTLILGLVVCVAIAGAAYLAYSLLDQFLDPKQLVNYAGTILTDRLPNQRETLVQMVEDNSPEWAKMASDEIQKRMPEIRGKLQTFVLARVDEQLEKVTVLSAAQFRDFLKKNHDALAQGFDALKDEEKSKTLVDVLVPAMEQHLAVDAQQQAELLLDTLVEMNRKLEVLKKDERLSNEQALEREILMLARRLQETERPGSTGSAPTGDAPIATKPKPSGAAPADGDKPVVKEGAEPKAKEEAKPAGGEEPKKDGA